MVEMNGDLRSSLSIVRV